MTKEEFSRLPLETQFKFINEYAKEVFKEGEECANAFEYGRSCETEPTTFESYLAGFGEFDHLPKAVVDSAYKEIYFKSNYGEIGSTKKKQMSPGIPYYEKGLK